MPVTNNNPSNIKLGTCKVFLGGVDLGFTIGGVEFELVTTTHDSKVDQFGDIAINTILTGRQPKVTVPLAETTLDNLIATMPGATLVVDKTTPTKRRVDIKTGIGVSLFDLAQELRLHPIALPDTNVSEDIILPKAATGGNIKFSYKADSERVYNVEFKGYPDANGVIVQFGDKTATTG